MRPNGPTFWLLNGKTGWRTAYAEEVADAASGIRLAADPQGPLALECADGSLGGLVLPRGMAFDNRGILYLLGLKEPWIKRFLPETGKFEPLPATGGHGREPRKFHEPVNIAIAGGNLYVVDKGNRRIQVFGLKTLVLRHLWGPLNARGNPVAMDDPDAWEPVDVFAGEGAVYILDRRHGRVYRHRAGTAAPTLFLEAPARKNQWSRLAVDRQGRICLLTETRPPCLEIYSPAGELLGQCQDAGQLRDRFETPPIRLDHRGRFCLPEGLMRPCPRQAAPPAPEAPLQHCRPFASGGVVFDRQGRPTRVDAGERPGPRRYAQKGFWFSEALDSRIHGCQWHRIELDLADMPPGCRVVVSTCSEDADDQGKGRPVSPGRALPEHLWETRFAVTGPMQRRGDAPYPDEREFLIQSRPGQCLRLRLELSGDGYGTPVVRTFRVHYPRQSYLEYLPAVYSSDHDGRWFLERFLSVFQTEWDRLEHRLEDLPRYFDPGAVPAGKFLAYLARWLSLPLEGSWNEDQKRRLLAAAPRLHAKRGTMAGLRDYLGVYLANMTGWDPDEIASSGYPVLVEGFRERRRLMLSMESTASLGRGAPLWGPGQVGRLQLDAFAREGEVKLVSTGDPERDLFHEYAHRFRVFVPAPWVSSPEDERMLRRALEAEKPAHTRYDLCLVEPRFCVGNQSSLGIDTIIGDYPFTRLACAREDDAAGGGRSGHRLGKDTLLGKGSDEDWGQRFAPGVRVGPETVLT